MDLVDRRKIADQHLEGVREIRLLHRLGMAVEAAARALVGMRLKQPLSDSLNGGACSGRGQCAC
jgi:hypothetical protein